MVAHQVGNRRLAVLGAVSLMALAIGCGGGGGATTDGGAGTGGGNAGTGGGNAGTSGGAGTGAPAGSAVAQCNEFVDTFCTRSVTCAVDAGANDKATCVRRLGVYVGCERATTSFAECLQDTKALSCSSLAAGPPPSCDEPIGTTPLSTAQMKCIELAGVYCAWSAKCQNLTPTAAQLANCQGLVADDFGCFFATNVVQACIDDLPTAPCAPPDGGAVDASAPVTPSCDDPITLVD
jgi:hypothetical protein